MNIINVILSMFTVYNSTSYPDICFKFDRLGLRIPTLSISPWIKKGTVLSNPPDKAKPFTNSEYKLTSIIASTRKLLGMNNVGSLTKRNAWAATLRLSNKIFYLKHLHQYYHKIKKHKKLNKINL